MTLLLTPVPSRPVHIPIIAFLDTDADTGSASTYNFSGFTFGTAHHSRAIVVATCGRSTAARSVTGITVGGVTASLLRHQEGTGGTSTSELWIAKVPTGTSGTISVDWSGSMNNCGVAAWSIKHLRSLSPVDTAASAGDANTINVSVANRGVAVAASMILLSDSTCTWTGVTENFDAAIDSGENTYFSGGLYQASTPTTRAITANWPGSSTAVATVAASFR